MHIKNRPRLELATELALKYALYKIRKQEKVKKYIFEHIGIKHTYGYIPQKELNKNIILKLHSTENYIKNLER